jgi:hypothetical protein
MINFYKLRKSSLAVKLKNLIPSRIRSRIYQSQRAKIFKKAIAELKACIRDKKPISDELLFNLCFGWGNMGFSSDTSYLRAIINYCLKGNLHILECGSGLSTIVMGIIGDQYNNSITALENHEQWHDKINKELQKQQIKCAKTMHAPLVNYGDFHWYDIQGLDEKIEYDLSICDGPPSKTLGGRIGLLYLIDKSLKPGATILLDDYMRAEEQSIVRDWIKRYDYTVNDLETNEVFAVLNKKA